MNLVLMDCKRVPRFLRHGRHYLPFADALRGGLICAVPAVLAAVLHEPLLCWSAIAAFWTCLADEADRSTRERCEKGLLFAVLGGLMSACAVATHAVPILSIAIVGVIAFAGAWMRGRGPASGVRGLLTATACSVSACFPAHGPTAALHYALYYLGGSAWAAIACVSLWQTSGTARASKATLAFLYAMASFVERLAHAAKGDRTQLERGRAELRARLDAMSAAIARARGQLPHACRKWLKDGEPAMALLAGMETLLAGGHTTARRDAATFLAPALVELAALIDTSAARVRGAAGDDVRALERCHARLLRAAKRGVPDYLAVHEVGDALTWLQANLELAERLSGLVVCEAEPSATASAAPLAAAGPVDRTRRGSMRALIGELAAQQGLARYAARLSVATMVAVTLARVSGIQQGYWLALTTMLILQPTLSQTVKVSGLRIGGTLLGAALASALALLVHSPLLLALAILPLATGTLAARGVSYVSYILFLTSHFILVAHLGAPAGSEWLLAVSRLGNSVAGALVGVAFSLFAWPDREHHRLSHVAARAISATDAYLQSLTRCLAQPAQRDRADLTTLRRQACLAIDTLEATIAAIRFESLAVNQRAACASVLMQRTRTLVGALSPLEHIDDALSEADLIVLGELVREAQAIIGGASYGRGGPPPRLVEGVLKPTSCYAREIRHEVMESAWTVQTLQPRVVQ